MLGETTMTFVEVIMDRPDFFRLTRVGYWYHCYDYETDSGEWFHGTLTEASEWFEILSKITLPVVGHVA